MVGEAKKDSGNMSLHRCLFSPKLFKYYGDPNPMKLYEPETLEKFGDNILSLFNVMWNFSLYTSPIILTMLYRRGYFVMESLSSALKLSTGIGLLVLVSYCLRGYGRCRTLTYTNFLKALDQAQKNRSEEVKRELRNYDFDFAAWPVDFDINDINGDETKNRVRLSLTPSNKGSKTMPIWISTLPCQILAYLAIHSFGIKMIYPGSISILQSFLREPLIRGRFKLVVSDSAVRYKLKTADNNEIDTIFVDNRQSMSPNGKTLVICSEGNAGFYEIGIMTTPLSLNYSVLGWNHPGFGGSTGKPYPDQDENAIDAVLQFAIHKLNYNLNDIILNGWSIGAYSSLWAATRYPEVKAIILDATFDDILPLALPRMPQFLSGIVKIAIRNYVNLHNLELINNYNGPVLFIRRTEDEVICTEEGNLSSNRGNNLTINFLKNRFPNIFLTEQIVYANNLLSRPLDKNRNVNNDQLCQSLLNSYLTDTDEDRVYPVKIGQDYTTEQRNQMAEFLIRRHLLDLKSSHCTPLPVEFFQLPWNYFGNKLGNS